MLLHGGEGADDGLGVVGERLPGGHEVLGPVRGLDGEEARLEPEERGALDENRDVDEAKFYKGMMKSVRTVRMPELTDAQIKAARERRRQSRINEDGDDDAASVLRATELPSNHPFATSEAVDGNLSAKQAAKIRELNKPRRRGNGAGGRKDR